MTATSTAITACDAAIWLDNASGVPTDVSGSTSSVTINLGQDVQGYSVFGTGWVQRSAGCAKEASVTIESVYTLTANEGFDLLRDWFTGASSGEKRTLRIQLPNTGIGSDSYEGEFVIASLNWKASAGDSSVIMSTAELKSHGAVTYGVNATS